MERIDAKFKPEDPEYSPSIMTTPMAIHVFACVFLLVHLTFSIALMIIGRKKVRDFFMRFSYRNWKLNLAIFMIFLSLILWISAAIMILISSFNGNSALSTFEGNSKASIGIYIKSFDEIGGQVNEVNSMNASVFPGNSTAFSVKMEKSEAGLTFVQKISSFSSLTKIKAMPSFLESRNTRL